jgi:hypothetical protein
MLGTLPDILRSLSLDENLLAFYIPRSTFLYLRNTMPSTVQHELVAASSNMDVCTGTAKSELTPLSHVTMCIAPTLFIVLYACFVTCSPYELGKGFFLALVFIFSLAVLVDRVTIKLHECLTCISYSANSTAENHQLVRERLQSYKNGYEKAIKKRDAALAKQAAVMKTLLDLQEGVDTLQTDLIASYEQRKTDYLDCRKDQNNTRIIFYKALHTYQTSILDDLDKLVRKFKNVSVPKGKGVSASKSNSNSLTGPLERLASGLKSAQQVTMSQITVVEKIKEILDSGYGGVSEMYDSVANAEKVLESVEGRSVVPGAGKSDTGMQDWEEKLEVQVKKLDEYYKGIVAKVDEGTTAGEEEE